MLARRIATPLAFKASPLGAWSGTTINSLSILIMMKCIFFQIVISPLIIWGSSVLAHADKLEEIAGLNSYYEKFKAIENLAEKGTRNAAETLLLMVQSDQFDADLKNKAAWELFDRFFDKNAVEDWVGSNLIDTEALLRYIDSNEIIDWREDGEDIVYGVASEKFALSLSKDDFEKGDQDDVLSMSVSGLIELFNEILKEKFDDFVIRTVQITFIHEGEFIFSSAAYTDNVGYRRTVVYLGNGIVFWDEKIVQ